MVENAKSVDCTPPSPTLYKPHVHRRSHGDKWPQTSQIFRISSHFVLRRQYLKQNTLAHLKSNILTHPKFWSGHATAHVCQLLFHLGKIWLLVNKR